MSTPPHEPPKLGELTTEQFRLALAGLLDPQAKESAIPREEIKALAIAFVGGLPEVFGKELDRLKMWDRIATAVQSAFAKTACDDHEFFVAEVLGHIKANPSEAADNESIANTLDTLGGWPSVDRQGWLNYLHSHLIPVMVHARKRWTTTKETKKAESAAKKSRNAPIRETLGSFLPPEEVVA